MVFYLLSDRGTAPVNQFERVVRPLACITNTLFKAVADLERVAEMGPATEVHGEEATTSLSHSLMMYF